MNVALVKSQSETAHDRLFASVRDRLPGKAEVAKLRARAFDEFARQGLPHRRIEQWKYTDLRARLGEIAPPAAAPAQGDLTRAASAARQVAIAGALTIVLVDGVRAAALSTPAASVAGLKIASLAEAIDAVREDAFRIESGEATEQLTASLATDGVVIDIADGVVLAQPLHVIHVATRSSASAFTRSLVRLGRAARATLIEQFVAAPGAASYQSFDAVTVQLGDSAELEHVRLMEDALDAANITHAAFTLASGAKLNTFNLTRGAALSRYQGVVTFVGEGGTLATNGVNLLGGRRHGDTTLLVDHQAPGCTSRETFRSVLDQQGHSVFQGRIVVRPGAQQTDGKMMTRALLLSDEAEIDNKPELEIFADDVSCGHGATAGALDEGLLFYLMARGLNQADAQALLIEAFVGEAIEGIADETQREAAIEAARRWLAVRD